MAVTQEKHVQTRKTLESIDQALRRLAVGEAEKVQPIKEMESRPQWQALAKTGTEPWLDTGDIHAAEKQWDAAFKALTTNNTLLNREVQKGAYDAFIRQVADKCMAIDPDLSASQLVLEINLALNAAHGLKLARRFGANVSVELHTDLANDADASVLYGRRLHAMCADHFIVKVPYTPAGLVAARTLGQLEIPVNLTLGFSARQNHLAARFAKPRFVNVFVGRLNTFVEQSGLGSGDLVGEKAALATQRVVSALRESGETQSRLIGASLRNADQVDRLAGIDVLTMPPNVAEEYKPSGHVPENQVDSDASLRIGMKAGFTARDFNGTTLWNLEEPVHSAINNLMSCAVDGMDAETLMAHFEKLGAFEFMPKWSVDEIDTLLADGKIPDYEKWKGRLKGGLLGLDTLMNMSALAAFVNDQKALDDHIHGLLRTETVA